MEIIQEAEVLLKKLILTDALLIYMPAQLAWTAVNVAARNRTRDLTG